MSVNSMSRKTPSSWSNLQPDLLLSIADRLDITTSIRLSAVCTSWASTICPSLPSFPPIRPDQPIPWMLCFARNSHFNPNCSVLTFYDLSTKAYFSVQIPIPLLCEHHWMGSNNGWLVTLDQQLQLHLINPLTGTHVLLPSKGIENEHPSKVIMCQSPKNPNELQAFCLTQQGVLFYAKLGQNKWSWMAAGCEDIAALQGNVYAFSMNELCYWNPGGSFTKRTIIPSYFSPGSTKYLLEWNGELTMLKIDNKKKASLENHTPKRVEFCQFKHKYPVSWSTHFKSLGNDALFFGANCSYAMSSSGRDDIQGNCIYFTNQMSLCFHDDETSHPKQKFGRFDLTKQTYYKPCCPQNSPMHLPPPFWFWPCKL